MRGPKPATTTTASKISALGRARAFLVKFFHSELRPMRGATSEMKFEASLAAMSDAVFICDRSGVLTNINDAFVRFHRFKSREECKETVAEYPDIIDVCTLDGTALPVSDWPVPRALREKARRTLNTSCVVRISTTPG